MSQSKMTTQALAGGRPSGKRIAPSAWLRLPALPCRGMLGSLGRLTYSARSGGPRVAMRSRRRVWPPSSHSTTRTLRARGWESASAAATVPKMTSSGSLQHGMSCTARAQRQVGMAHASRFLVSKAAYNVYVKGTGRAVLVRRANHVGLGWLWSCLRPRAAEAYDAQQQYVGRAVELQECHERLVSALDGEGEPVVKVGQQDVCIQHHQCPVGEKATSARHPRRPRRAPRYVGRGERWYRRRAPKNALVVPPPPLHDPANFPKRGRARCGGRRPARSSTAQGVRPVSPASVRASTGATAKHDAEAPKAQRDPRDTP